MRPEIHLLRKIERLPAAAKVPVGRFARELGVTQAIAISMLEWLIHIGRLEPQTLRPFVPMPNRDWPDKFKSELAKVERGEAKIAPVVRIPSRAAAERTYGGVSTAYEGPA
jgi:hypothetical protein